MSGDIPLLSTYAFMACTGTTLPRTVNGIQDECTGICNLMCTVFVLCAESISLCRLLPLSRVQISLLCNFVIFSIFLLFFLAMSLWILIFSSSLCSHNLLYLCSAKYHRLRFRFIQNNMHIYCYVCFNLDKFI